jgi:hypothetical protein
VLVEPVLVDFETSYGFGLLLGGDYWEVFPADDLLI